MVPTGAFEMSSLGTSLVAAGVVFLLMQLALWAFAFSMVAIFFKPMFFFRSFVSFSAFFSVATCLLLLVGGAGSTTWQKRRPGLHTGVAMGGKGVGTQLG
jgi:hypothetical protein